MRIRESGRGKLSHQGPLLKILVKRRKNIREEKYFEKKKFVMNGIYGIRVVECLFGNGNSSTVPPTGGQAALVPRGLGWNVYRVRSVVTLPVRSPRGCLGSTTSPWDWDSMSRQRVSPLPLATQTCQQRHHHDLLPLRSALGGARRGDGLSLGPTCKRQHAPAGEPFVREPKRGQRGEVRLLTAEGRLQPDFGAGDKVPRVRPAVVDEGVRARIETQHLDLDALLRRGRRRGAGQGRERDGDGAPGEDCSVEFGQHGARGSGEDGEKFAAGLFSAVTNFY